MKLKSLNQRNLSKNKLCNKILNVKLLYSELEAKKINKKRLALIGVVTALIIIVGAVLFAQLLIQNSNTTSSPSPSLPSTSSQAQSLTQDDIATLKADSFELRIRDAIGYTTGSTHDAFMRIDNTTKLAWVLGSSGISLMNNDTVVSETTFLADLSPNFDNVVIRTGNTFYFNTGEYDPVEYHVCCTP